MDMPDHEDTGHFSQPLRQILSMVVVLGLVAFGVRLLAPEVAPVFLANLYLNGFIAFAFVIGVLSCFWQVYQVAGSARWLQGYVDGNQVRVAGHAPRLLAPLVPLLRSRPGRMQLTSTTARSILDSVATRIDESRDITRYLGNLLIFLGLLGTFYGLATTVPALVETIRSLSPREGEEGLDVFNRLMAGLEGQLGGMGTAFAASLLGLAGSLVVGLLELFASHGQGRFYREFEEWLSSITRVGFAPGDGEAMVLPPGMEAITGRLDALRLEYARTGDAGVAVDARIERLGDVVAALAGHLDRERQDGDALERIAAGQERLAALLESGAGGAGLARIADGQDRIAALLERSAGVPELTRVADGQDRLVALMQGGSGAPELARIAEGQERIVALLERDAGAEELARIADGQERLIASLREGIASPEFTRLADGQERIAALLERDTGAEDLARIAEGQERLLAAVRDGAGTPELARIAEGQERLVALMQGGSGAPELARLAEGQERVLDALERDATAPGIARLVAAQERVVTLLDERDPEIARLAEAQERAVAVLAAREPDLARIADAQERMLQLFEETGGGSLDAESRLHLRAIDGHLLRLIEEIAAGRQEAVDDLRSELAQLSRLLRQMSTGRRPDAPTPIVGRRG